MIDFLSPLFDELMLGLRSIFLLGVMLLRRGELLNRLKSILLGRNDTFIVVAILFVSW
jgi:hypothetical protein